MYGQPSSSRLLLPAGPTEFDILKASHKFLREDDVDNTKRDGNGKSSWDDRLAQKYYESLYREFAVCDLKHYKSGNFALRWRTEDEVVSGAGEETCGNTRCPLHHPSSLPSSSSSTPLEKPVIGLKTVELPFAYVEHGEDKQALVKVVLCETCLRKLMWKREKEKEKVNARMLEDEDGRNGNGNAEDAGTIKDERVGRKRRSADMDVKGGREEEEEKEREDRERRRRSRNGADEHDRRRKGVDDEESRKRDRSRSRSPSHRRRHREHREDMDDTSVHRRLDNYELY